MQDMTNYIESEYVSPYEPPKETKEDLIIPFNLKYTKQEKRLIKTQ